MISRRGLVTAAAGAFATTALSACSSGSGSASTVDAASANGSANAASDATNLYVYTQHEVESPKWVAELPAAKDENARQLLVVAAMGMDKTTAFVSMHERGAGGTWTQVLSTPGYVGKLGLCADADHKEGCNQTPTGVFHFTKAFGIADDPGCGAFDYVKVDDNIYWSGDDRSGMHYNEMVSIKDYPDLNVESSEHIVEYEYPYQYCLNISFNEDGTPGRGSAIFLHCLGTAKPYTGGCVSVPEYMMIFILRRVMKDCVVVIDTLENMHGEL